MAFVLATLPIQSRAQEMPDLAPGARLRVAGPAIDGPLVGTVVGADGKGLTLDVKGKSEPLIVPYGEITTVEISRGRSTRGKGAKIGALAGAAAGILLAVGTCGDNCAITTGSAAVILGAMGAGGGALLGVLVTHGERWEELSRKQSAEADSSHGLRLSVAIRF